MLLKFGVFLIISQTVFGDDDTANKEFLSPQARSSAILDTFALAEIKFAQALQPLLPTLTEQERLLAEIYLEDFKDANQKLRRFENGSLAEKVSAITYNPVALYRMVRRFTRELLELKKVIESTQEKLFELFPSYSWMDEQDIFDCASGMIRLSFVYHVSVPELADGIIRDVHTGANLKAIHCLDIAEFAETERKHAWSIMFAEVAVEKAAKDKTVDEEEAKLALNKYIKSHDKASKNNPDDVNLFERKIGPLRKKYGENYKFMRITNRVMAVGELLRSQQKEGNMINYWELCAFDNIQTDDEQKYLKCRLESKVDPYWTLMPLKLEVLSLYPDIYQIYDILGEKRINDIIRTAVQNLRPSSNTSDAKSRESTRQLAYMNSALLTTENYPEISSLFTLITKLTGCDDTYNESDKQLQVNSYTTSSFFMVHDDATNIDIALDPSTKLDRVAAALFYLEQPELGGGTAFPLGRVAAQPIKGSAIVWANLNSQGQTNLRATHGACPVLLGRKWVGLKYLHYKDQFPRHNCRLKKYGTFKLYN